MGFFSKDSDETKQDEASKKPKEETVSVKEAKTKNPQLDPQLEAVIEKMTREHDDPKESQDQANKGSEHEGEDENKGGGRG